MCINARWIQNRYTQNSLFVNCGKCSACQQERAQRRTSRLKATQARGEISLFVTLTYKNEYLPYIKLSDLAAGVWPLPLYRDYCGRWFFNRKTQRNEWLSEKCGVFDCLDGLDYRPEVVSKLVSAKRKKGCVSVCYFKDVQDFVKRLRTTITRRCGYQRIRIFQCSEYGPTTYRAHFHLLIFIPVALQTAFRSAIVDCWQFADENRTRNNIKVDWGAKSYVSSYVNRNTDFPTFLCAPSIKPKHSYSQDTGMDVSDFSVAKILERCSSGDMRYTKLVLKDRVWTSVTACTPQYVVSRYFPVFKGFNRLPLSSNGFTVYDFIRNPFDAKQHYVLMHGDVFVADYKDWLHDHPIEYSVLGDEMYPAKYERFRKLFDPFRLVTYEEYLGLDKDNMLYSISQRLAHCVARCGLYDDGEGNIDIHRYAVDYIRVHTVRSMTALKQMYESQIDDLSIVESYDNLDSYNEFELRCRGIPYRSYMNTDPNKFVARVTMDRFYKDMFGLYLKRKKMANHSASQIYDDI